MAQVSSGSQDYSGQSLHSRLTVAAAELKDLLAELEKILPHRPREGFRPPGASGSPSRGGSRLAAWNTAAAYAILEVHAGVRELEQDMRYRISGSLRQRGGSDSNTLAAIDAVVSLAAGSDDWSLRNALRKLERWGWQARLALGQTEPWTHIPRQPGQRAARCPWCSFATLRMKPLSGLVRCVNPACTDGAGQRPVAKVEFGPGFGEPLLVWQDSSVGLAVEDEREPDYHEEVPG